MNFGLSMKMTFSDCPCNFLKILSLKFSTYISFPVADIQQLTPTT